MPRTAFISPDFLKRSLVFVVAVICGCDTMPPVTRPPNRAPKIAGVDNKQVAERETVVLSAAGCTDPDGDDLKFEWSQVGGTAVTLRDRTAVQCRFDAPSVTAETKLSIRLVVRDEAGDTAEKSIDITVSDTNRPPTANAGADMTVAERDRITLNGAASTDPDRDDLVFQWSQVSGAAVTLSNGNTASAAFIAGEVSGSAAATLEFRLTVTDPDGKTSSDTVQVSVQNRNRAPVANPLSIAAPPGSPVLEAQLTASDADNDTVSFLLDAPDSGNGYQDAVIDPTSGRLYALITGTPGMEIRIPFKATDGKDFSSRTEITVTIADVAVPTGGQEDTPPDEYAGLPEGDFFGDVGGDQGLGAPSLPRAIDLSANFPPVGRQQEGSCVAWAVAYAAKTYQEKRERGWSLNTNARIFSPTYLFNQIKVNAQRCYGAFIPRAMQLSVDQGLATLATAPYTPLQCAAPPSGAARAEAASYKSRTYERVSGSDSAKRALANGLPVVIAMQTCREFSALRGSASVLPAALGTPCEGHAVCMVGYDDDRYGGAFKVMNSWGADWGDRGFFWIPYSLFRTPYVKESYVMHDIEGGTPPPPPNNPAPPPPPPPPSGFADLRITYWQTNFDQRPGGAGTLKYDIVNAGTAATPANVRVALMLSSNDSIAATDYYVVYERIPFAIDPGRGASRGDNNKLNFTVPTNIPAGNYYLAFWVDDDNTVRESNEANNVSLSSGGAVAITSTLPDLRIRTWTASWEGNGAGRFQYTVANDGSTACNNSTWDINLVLSPNSTIGDGNEYFLFYEDAGYALNPGGTVYRNSNNAANFNLLRTQEGNSVPDGTYYMAVWLDDQREVAESSESNNVSIGNTQPRIARGGRMISPDLGEYVGLSGNGLKPHAQELQMQMVQVTTDAKNGRRIRAIDNAELRPPTHGVAEPIATKEYSSRDFGVFPVIERIEMP